MKKQLLIISAPSGAGKTTIAQHLLRQFPQLRFSVSATTRPRRTGEVHGKHYFFLSNAEFERRIRQGDLVEYEEIFGNYYGTLKSEINKALQAGEYLIFDVDVRGALNLNTLYPEQSVLVFITPPSISELERRLDGRNTESAHQRSTRLSRAHSELAQQKKFHHVITNDRLEQALAEAHAVVQRMLDPSSAE